MSPNPTSTARSRRWTPPLGQAKVQAMRERIAQINPACAVHGVEEFVEPGNWPAAAARGRRRGDRRLRPGPGQAGHGGLGAADRHAVRDRGRGRRQAAGPPGRTSTTWRSAPTIRCWPSCATACARSTARRAKARRSASPASSAAKPVAPPDPSCAVEGDGSLNCHGYGSRRQRDGHLRPMRGRLGDGPDWRHGPSRGRYNDGFAEARYNLRLCASECRRRGAGVGR